MDMAIGSGTLKRICSIGSDIWYNNSHVRGIDEFPSGLGVFTLSGSAVPACDWHDVWDEYPEWYEKAYMLADNGDFTFDQVAKMSVEQIESLYDDPEYQPAYCYYTEA